ncbi:MAG: sirohydrochlorin cobaltochelatase [Methanotrichaceae archaeon]|nr:sirohydrochlorin cobaltochelatase [Methanotrichaceae archaeon]
MPMREKPGIVLAPYGTLFPPALATYDQIKRAYEREFPGSPVRLAFTSRFMRKKLLEKEGIIIPGLLAALAELHDLGYESVAVQSLQIVPGEEFHQVEALLQGLKGSRRQAFSRLEMGLPLLSDLKDCFMVSSLLPYLCMGAASNSNAADDTADDTANDTADEKLPHASPLRDPEKEAVLLVGHGTGHPADALYSLMAQILKREHKNVFLGTIEGFFGIEELLPELSRCGARAVRLLPFLLVAGGHAKNDIFGHDPESWKSNLEREGYEVVADLRGLGERVEIVSLFLEHTRNALEKMENR